MSRMGRGRGRGRARSRVGGAASGYRRRRAHDEMVAAAAESPPARNVRPRHGIAAAGEAAVGGAPAASSSVVDAAASAAPTVSEAVGEDDGAHVPQDLVAGAQELVDDAHQLTIAPRFREALESVFASSDAARCCGGAWLLSEGVGRVATHVLVVDCVAKPGGAEVASQGRTQLVSHLAENNRCSLLGWVVSHNQGLAAPTAAEVKSAWRMRAAEGVGLMVIIWQRGHHARPDMAAWALREDRLEELTALQGGIGSEDPASYFMPVTMHTGGEGPTIIRAGAIRVELPPAAPRCQLRRSLSSPAVPSTGVAVGGAASMAATRASGLLLFLRDEKAAGRALRVSEWYRRCPASTATHSNIGEMEASIRTSLLHLESERKIALQRRNRQDMHTWIATIV